MNSDLTMDYEKFESLVMNSHKKGATMGQCHIIYYLHMILKGYLSGDALQQNDVNDVTWNKLQEVIAALTVKAPSGK